MKIIIVESGTSDIDYEMRQEMLDWAKDLGVDTKRAATAFVLAETPEGGWRAHFSMKQQRDGHDYVLPGTNRVATDYGSFVVDLTEGGWPRWFGAPDEIQPVPIPALLEVLAAAAGARLQLHVTHRRRDKLTGVAW